MRFIPLFLLLAVTCASGTAPMNNPALLIQDVVAGPQAATLPAGVKLKEPSGAVSMDEDGVFSLTKVLGGNADSGGLGWNSGGAGLTITRNSTGNFTIAVDDYPDADITAVASLTELAANGDVVRVTNGTGSVTVVVTDSVGAAKDGAFGIVVFVN